MSFQQVKTLRGGNGRRSHDEARPWGGLGFDVKSNTYASESGGQASGSGGQAGPGDGSGSGGAEPPAGSGAAASASASPGGSRRSSVGSTPRKGLAETSPGGRTRLLRGEGFIERLLGSRVVAGTPKY